MLTTSASGKPDAVAQQHGHHGDQGDAVLEHAAQVLEQHHRPVAGLVLRAMEMIEVLGQIVVGQVDLDGLAVNQAANVILDQLGQGGAHPAGGAAQHPADQQHHRHQPERQQRRPDGLPGGALAQDRHQAVHDGSGQGHGGGRKQPLHGQERDPGDGPARGRIPDQAQRAREVREQRKGPPELGGNEVQAAGHVRAKIGDKPALDQGWCIAGDAGGPADAGEGDLHQLGQPAIRGYHPLGTAADGGVSGAARIADELDRASE